MKNEVKYVVALTLISSVSAAILAFVSGVTAGPIAESRRNETLNAIRMVLPPFDNEPDKELLKAAPPDGRTLTAKEAKRLPTIYPARKNGKLVGAALNVINPNGYGGDVSLMVGVTRDFKVHSIYILNHKETPGLGSKMTGEKFSSQFRGFTVPEGGAKVTKDGGTIHAITGATISSRAVTAAVNEAVRAYRDNLKRFAEAKPGTGHAAGPAGTAAPTTDANGGTDG